MGIGTKLNDSLHEFEEKTDGILGSCVIISAQALMMAEASSHFDRGIIQGMSERFMRCAPCMLCNRYQRRLFSAK